jgi:hypothetical protein
MVRAILAGHKTQTRRVAQTKGASICDSAPFGDLDWTFAMNDSSVDVYEHGPIFLKVADAGTEAMHRVFPKFKVGDILWVRETWREWDSGLCGCGGDICHCPPDGSPLFRADIKHKMSQEEYRPWRPSIFMPKRHCRIFLKIRKVSAQHIVDITEADAMAEGINCYDREPGFASWGYDGQVVTEWNRDTPIYAFDYLWDSINAKRGFGISDNPWVWAYTFERTDRPAEWPGN